MLHPLAENYLDRLERASDHLPGSRRRELVQEIRSHLVEALGPSPIDAEVAVELERLGDPDQIAEAEAPRPAPANTRRGWRPTPAMALALLIVGGLFGPLGLLPGLIAISATRGWKVRDRVIVAALCVAAADIFAEITLPILSRGDQLCGLRNCVPSGGLEIALGCAAWLLPLIAAGYLTRRAARRSAHTSAA